MSGYVPSPQQAGPAVTRKKRRQAPIWYTVQLQPAVPPAERIRLPQVPLILTHRNRGQLPTGWPVPVQPPYNPDGSMRQESPRRHFIRPGVVAPTGWPVPVQPPEASEQLRPSMPRRRYLRSGVVPPSGLPVPVQPPEASEVLRPVSPRRRFLRTATTPLGLLPAPVQPPETSEWERARFKPPWPRKGVAVAPVPPPIPCPILVGSNFTTGGGATTTCSPNQPLPQGASIIVCVTAAASGKVVSGVTDTQGNVYTQISTPVTNHHSQFVFETVLAVPLAVTDVITATFSTTANSTEVIDLVWIPGYSIKDQEGETSTSGSQLTDTVTTSTLLMPDELALCFFASTSSAGVLSLSTGWLDLVSTSASVVWVTIGWQFPIGTSGLSVTGTVGTATGITGTILTFLPVPPGQFAANRQASQRRKFVRPGVPVFSAFPPPVAPAVPLPASTRPQSPRRKFLRPGVAEPTGWPVPSQPPFTPDVGERRYSRPLYPRAGEFRVPPTGWPVPVQPPFPSEYQRPSMPRRRFLRSGVVTPQWTELGQLPFNPSAERPVMPRRRFLRSGVVAPTGWPVPVQPPERMQSVRRWSRPLFPRKSEELTPAPPPVVVNPSISFSERRGSKPPYPRKGNVAPTGWPVPVQPPELPHSVRRWSRPLLPKRGNIPLTGLGSPPVFGPFPPRYVRRWSRPPSPRHGNAQPNSGLPVPVQPPERMQYVRRWTRPLFPRRSEELIATPPQVAFNPPISSSERRWSRPPYPRKGVVAPTGWPVPVQPPEVPRSVRAKARSVFLKRYQAQTPPQQIILTPNISYGISRRSKPPVRPRRSMEQVPGVPALPGQAISRVARIHHWLRATVPPITYPPPPQAPYPPEAERPRYRPPYPRRRRVANETGYPVPVQPPAIPTAERFSWRVRQLFRRWPPSYTPPGPTTTVTRTEIPTPGGSIVETGVTGSIGYSGQPGGTIAESGSTGTIGYTGQPGGTISYTQAPQGNVTET